MSHVSMPAEIYIKYIDIINTILKGIFIGNFHKYYQTADILESHPQYMSVSELPQLYNTAIPVFQC